jgi:hypothetical protein
MKWQEGGKTETSIAVILSIRGTLRGRRVAADRRPQLFTLTNCSVRAAGGDPGDWVVVIRFLAKARNFSLPKKAET